MDRHRVRKIKRLRKAKRFVSIALLGALATGGLLASGCLASAPPMNRIDVSYDRQYQDIPVPFNFDYDRQESWAYTHFEDEPLRLRSCVLVYWGDRPLSELRNWYLAQMPKHDWVHEESFVDANRDRLIFSKGTELAEIDLKRMLSTVDHQRITRLVASIGVR